MGVKMGVKFNPNSSPQNASIHIHQLSIFCIKGGPDGQSSGPFYCAPSSGEGIYSKMSPGWQFSTWQILSRAYMGYCFTLPVQIADTVGGLMPVFSANSFWVISRMASITLSLDLITPCTSFEETLPRFSCKIHTMPKKFFAFQKKLQKDINMLTTKITVLICRKEVSQLAGRKQR